MARWQKALVSLSLLLLLSCGGVRGDAPQSVPSNTLPSPLPLRVNAVPARAKLPAPEQAKIVAAPVTALPAAPAALVPTNVEPTINPVERDYPLHAVAYQMFAQVFVSPASDAVVTGYLRRGSRLRVKPATRGAGCSGGQWHEVLGGGFVCSSNGFQVGKTPQTFSPAPLPAALYAELPYTYRKATSAALQYFRAPTKVEEHDVERFVADAKVRGVLPVPRLQLTTDATSQLAKTTSDAGPTPIKTPIKTEALPDYVRMLMQPGFYVTVDGHEELEGRELARTVRGSYVQSDALAEVAPPGLQGFVFGVGDKLPLALAQRAGAPTYTRDPMTGVLSAAASLSLLEPLRLTDEVVFRDKRRARVASDGRIVPEDVVRIVEPMARPALVPSRARWIGIKLSTQTLVAYEGDKPVFATLVSTGKPGYETKTGIFRIQGKHVSATMDGEAATDEAYSIEDVPWTMYFSGSLALHAAFWHRSFGRERSHGCVNLAPADARWLFGWTAPMLPAGFHGVLATRDNPGTFVVIEP